MRQGWSFLTIFCFLALGACGANTSLRNNRPAVCGVDKSGHSDGQRAGLQESLGRSFGKQIDKVKGGVSITIPSDSLFKPDSGRVQLADLTEIETVADVGKKYPKTKIEVNAYTDCVRSEEQNLALTELQAWVIKKALVDKGVGSSRITAQGWGESRPVASNATAEGRKANRRVTITFEQRKS